MTIERCVGGDTRVKTVLVSRPGAVQASVRATLVSFPQIALIGSAAGGLSALDTIDQERPALLVIDNNLSEEEVNSLLRTVKQQYPSLYCVVLVDTATEQRRVLSAGADKALIRDGLSELLLDTLRELGALEDE